MDRRSVSRLAALLAVLGTAPGCMEAPTNDGRMFQRWAQVVADVPTSDEEAFARAGRAAPKPGAEAKAPGVTLTAEAMGLRAPIRIDVVDPLELPNARDAGLRTIAGFAEDAPARLQRAVFRTPEAAPAATRGASAARATPATGGRFAAQLGAFRSRAEAEAAWSKVSARLPGVSPRFETVTVAGKGPMVRLKAGPLPTAEAAANVCRAAGVSDPWCAKAKLG